MTQSISYNSQQNKEYWDKTNESYNIGWKTAAKKTMARKEGKFIIENLNKTAGETVLDIGVGTGRIIKQLNDQPSVKHVYGIDISAEMIKEAEKVLMRSPKVEQLAQLDIAHQELPFVAKYDFVTIIRVLKYIPNWQEAVVRISKSLAENGIIVFTVNNAASINMFAPTDNPFYRVSPAQIRKFAQDNGFEIVAMESFTRIPDKIYDFINMGWYAFLIRAMEKMLSIVFGKYIFGRILFVAIRKVN